MKGFSQVFDLEECEVLCYREGNNEVKFHFWLRKEDEALSATATKEYPSVLIVDMLFSTKTERLKQDAIEVQELVFKTLANHGDEMEEGKRYTVTGTRRNDDLDDSGQDPAAYARWLTTLSEDDLTEELSERRHDWNTCPAEQDDYNYEVRYDACLVEVNRRHA